MPRRSSSRSRGGGRGDDAGRDEGAFWVVGQGGLEEGVCKVGDSDVAEAAGEASDLEEEAGREGEGADDAGGEEAAGGERGEERGGDGLLLLGLRLRLDLASLPLLALLRLLLPLPALLPLCRHLPQELPRQRQVQGPPPPFRRVHRRHYSLHPLPRREKPPQSRLPPPEGHYVIRGVEERDSSFELGREGEPQTVGAHLGDVAGGHVTGGE